MGLSSPLTLPLKSKNNVSFIFAFLGPSTKCQRERAQDLRVVGEQKIMEKRPPKTEIEDTKNEL